MEHETMFSQITRNFGSLLGGLSLLANAAWAQSLVPSDVGTVVNGFQDDFAGTVLRSEWTPSGGALDVYSVSDGLLHVSTAAGDPNHLLYTLPGYDGTTQEVLARIRVLRFGSGDQARGGVGVGIDRTTSQGINYHFRDGADQTGRHTSFLDDFRVWGPGYVFPWQDNVWYWVRLRQEPNASAQGGASDVFAKIWAGDGSVGEPANWQTWDYIPARSARSGFAGITAGSSSGTSEFDVDYILIKASGLPSITVTLAAFPLFNPGPVTITAQPKSLTVLPCSPAVFSVSCDGTPPYGFQWFRNGLTIPGAVNASYTVALAQRADDGAVYKVTASNTAAGQPVTVTSADASLQVSRDLAPPALVGASSTGLNRILLNFSQPVTSASAENPLNYAITMGASSLPIGNATLLSSLTNVMITTTGQLQDVPCTITVNNIFDLCTGQNRIASDSRATVTARAYSSIAIGAAPLGSIMAVTGGFDLTGAGTGLGGVSDQLQFSYQPRAGDFDVKVRVAALSASNLWTETGLLARETLAEGSRFAATLATPGMSGLFFKSRTVAGGTTAAGGSFPVNYPHTWLRLQRAGNQFTGYASRDGQNWTVLGAASLPLPATIFLGFALASHDAAQSSTAALRDFSDVINPGNEPPATIREPLGQSSRTTSLIISEIMYHPGAKLAGTNSAEFVELGNTLGTPEDISGYRLDGDIHFGFPANTIIPAGGFLVIAAAPADLQMVYNFSGALGPYSGHLGNGSGKLQLRSRAGAILLEVNYESHEPWPVAADGSGHSLILSRPSFGENDPRAWASSDSLGGSPGQADGITPDPMRAVVINEFLAHTEDLELDFIELYNHGNQPVDLSGAFLSDDPGTNKFLIPKGTLLPSRGFLSYQQNELGFSLRAEGETLYFGNHDRVLEALRYEGQENGVAFGRSPDGAPQRRALASKTPGSSNSVFLQSDIVLNEIMHSPISGEEDDQYVELYNRGNSAVNLAGWKFISGLSFTFPANASLAADSYLVVARNVARLRGRYPNLGATNSLGDFTGKLAGQGERIALARPDTIISTSLNGALQTNLIDVVVNEVAYQKGGRWGQWSSGGGSSLELIDPQSDNSLAGNWADSDETAKASWTTISRTGLLDNGSTTANQLQVLLQGAGECLIDDVEVLNASGVNLVSNPSFENGAAGWFAEGTEEASGLELSGGFNSTRSYHVRAVDRGDNQVNRVRTPLTSSVPANSTATIRAKVRWLRGHPTVLFRLLGNWLEAVGELNLPLNPGTPGARNSRFASNGAPAIYDVTHWPVLPSAGQSALVTARAGDPNGLSSLTLKYRMDPATTYSSAPMLDDGTGGDAMAGDGLYSARIPGQPAGTLAAFFIQATDAAQTPATSTFPADGPIRECLVRFGEVQPAGNLPVYRMWMTAATIAKWNSRNKLNNAALDFTFVLGNHRVIYNSGGLYAGSPYIAPGYCGVSCARCGYSINFPDDDLFLGSSALVLDWPGGHGGETTGIQEQLGYWIADRIGLPYCHRYTIRLHVNGVTDEQRSAIFEAVNQPSGDFIKAWSPGAVNPDFYKIDVGFEFNDAGSLVASPSPTLQVFNTAGGVKKRERYRWNWSKRAGDDENNYTNIFNLVDAANSSGPEPYTTRLEDLVDTEEWMGIFATEHMINNFDSWGHDIGKNMYALKSEGRKWQIFMFDLDWLMLVAPGGPGNYTALTGPLFNAQDSVVVRMFTNPWLRRAYFRALQAALDGPFLSSVYEPVMDAKYASLVANGIRFCDGQALASPTALKKWFADRRTYLAKQVANVKTTFVLNNPGPLTVTTPEVTLTGSAPIDVKTIAINGIPWPVTWSTVTNWSLRYPLRRVSTELVLASFDRAGGLIPGASHVIQVTYTGPALAPPAIYINEWMASNTRALADNSSGLAKYDDWFELYNAGTETASLEGFFLTDDPANKIQFKIPAGYSIASGGYLLVWADNEPDQNRTTSPDLHVNFQLSAKGESIGLYAPDGEPVDLVTFGPQMADISQGRCPNGSTNITTLSTPSPGAPNQCALATVLIKSFTRTGDQLTLTWQTDAGQRYRIESKDDLNAAAWSLASPEQIANGAVLSATVPILTNHQRFYRVAR